MGDKEYDGIWRFRNGEIDFRRRTAIMGIVNATPDSFSDGGQFFDRERAVEQGLKLVEDGADILDIGGESTRPGSESVSVEEELRRTVPVIRDLARKVSVPISIDTTKAVVAREAVEAGAEIVNDISAGTFDPEMVEVVRSFDHVKFVLMHTLGNPKTMQNDPRYDDVVSEVFQFLKERVELAEKMGIPRERIAVDPGIGFGKTLEHNLLLQRRLSHFKTLGCPVLLGASRKSFIGLLTGLPVDQRLEGSLASFALGVANGADIIRVHDVKESHAMRLVADAIVGKRSEFSL